MQSSVLAVAASIPAAGVSAAAPAAASASGGSRANDHARDTKVCNGKVSLCTSGPGSSCLAEFLTCPISCHSTLLSLGRTLPPCLIRSISLMSSKKYAPDADIVVAGSGKAKKMKGAVKSAPVATDKGDALANLEAWGDWRMEAVDDTPRVLLVNVRSCVNACYYLVLSIIYEICATIFSAKNFKISNDRTTLARSARRRKSSRVQESRRFQRVQQSPRAFVLLGALLHTFVGLKRTWDQKLSSGLTNGQLNLAISGLMLLTHMTIHLFPVPFREH